MNERPTDHTAEKAGEFAARLRRIRERQKMTQSDLGTASGLSAAAISQLESGERRPNFNTLISLARALKTTPDVLLNETSKETGEPELRALFRKLEGMSAEDVDNVKAFISYLKSQKKE